MILSVIGCLRDRRGATAVEFAFVMPAFLMFVFLILDGGRMIFNKQSLNDLAAATARCAAIKATGCADVSSTQTWAVNRGLVHDAVRVAPADVTVTMSTSCFNQANMTQVTISVPWRRGAMTFLPQSVAPANLQATSCFPVAS